MKRNFKRVVFSLGALLFLASCQSDDDKSSVSKCDFDVIIDGDLFVVPTPDPFTIVNAEIINDCLEITIGASGCDGNSWDVNLISNYPITNEFTVGTDLSLKFVNIEDCEAFLMSTYSFNLAEIYEDYSNATFSLEGWDGELQLTN
jgi:hypothetical protein